MANPRIGSRVGAAAFVLGLSLAGPQVAGVAAADTPDGDTQSASTGPADSRPDRASRAPQSAGGAAGRGAAPRVRVPGDAESVPPAVGRRALPAAARRATAARQGATIADNSRGSAASVAPVAPVPSAAIPLAPPPGAAVRTRGATGAVRTGTGLATAAGAVTPDLPSVTAGAVAQPVPPALEAAPSQQISEADRGVRNFFTRLSDLLNDVPSQEIRTTLEGALLLLRRTLFNQNAVASPVQTTFDPTNLGAAVTGDVGAVDPEGDALTYELVSAPRYGTVVVDGNGGYRYTPGEAFAGQDAFAVKVTSEGSGINLFGLGQGRATDVTVRVGENAPASPFATADNLKDLSAAIDDVAFTVKLSTTRNLAGYYQATVALKVPSDTPVTWHDDDGQRGVIALPDAVRGWDGFRSAGDVRLGADFTLPNGVSATLVMTDVQASYNQVTGAYEFSGYLASDPANTDAEFDSEYDVIGKKVDTQYDNFRRYYGVPIGTEDGSKFTGATVEVYSGDVFADSYSIADYKEEVDQANEENTKAGVTGVVLRPATSGAQAVPGGAGSMPGADAAPTVPTYGATIETLIEGTAGSDLLGAAARSVTALVSYGSGVAIGGSDGSVQVWTPGNDVTTIQQGGLKGWDSAVNVMMEYKDGFIVGLQNGAVFEWASEHPMSLTPQPLKDKDGKDLPVTYSVKAIDKNGNIVGNATIGNAFDGATNKTSYVNYSGAGSGVIIDLGEGHEAKATGLVLHSGNNPNSDPTSCQVWGSADGKTFTEITRGPQSLSGVKPSERWDEFDKVYFPVPTDDVETAGATHGKVAKIPATAYRYYKVVFPTLRSAEGGTFLEVGGIELRGLDPDPSWRELSGQALGFGSPVTAALPYGQALDDDGTPAFESNGTPVPGFVVGLGQGGVKQWTGTGWVTLGAFEGAVTSMTPFKDGFVIGLGRGAGVKQWTGTTWAELPKSPSQLAGTTRSVKAVVPYGTGFVVALTDGGGLEQWTGTEWKTLPDPGIYNIATVTPYGDYGLMVTSTGNVSAAWFTGTGWTYIEPPSGFGAGVGATLPYQDGLVFGLRTLGGKTAGVVKWSGPDPAVPLQDLTNVLPESAFTAALNDANNRAGNPVLAFDNKPDTNYVKSQSFSAAGTTIDMGAGNSSIVTTLTITTSGNVADYADPSSYLLYGSDTGAGSYTLISSGRLNLPGERGASTTVDIANTTAYRYYLVRFPSTKGADAAQPYSCGDRNDKCLSVAEIELGGYQDWYRLPDTYKEGTQPEVRVTSMLPFDNGFIVGLQNGAVNQWVVGPDGAGRITADGTYEPWQELVQANPADPSFTNDILKQEIEFVQQGGTMFVDGAFNPADPVFSQARYQPTCAQSDSCDGTFYDFTSPGDLEPGFTPVAKTLGNLAVSASIDYGIFNHGYVFVPSGVWAKLDPDDYSAAAVTAMTVGPTVSVTLGTPDSTVANKFNILEKDYEWQLIDVPNVVSFEVVGGVKAKLDAQLTGVPEGAEGKLSAGYYYTTGMVNSYNTTDQSGLDATFRSYSTTKNDFSAITSLTISPTIAPFIGFGFGMFTPAIPIIGKITVFEVKAGYENPLTLDLTIAKNDNAKPGDPKTKNSGAVSSEGDLDWSFEAIPWLTSALTYADSLEVYKVSKTFGATQLGAGSGGGLIDDHRKYPI